MSLPGEPCQAKTPTPSGEGGDEWDRGRAGNEGVQTRTDDTVRRAHCVQRRRGGLWRVTGVRRPDAEVGH